MKATLILSAILFFGCVHLYSQEYRPKNGMPFKSRPAYKPLPKLGLRVDSTRQGVRSLGVSPDYEALEHSIVEMP